MSRHTRTDPACRDFRPPRFWWQLWLFDRARGRGCPICGQAEFRVQRRTRPAALRGRT